MVQGGLVMTSLQLSVATIFVPMCFSEPVRDRSSQALDGFSCADYQLIAELELEVAGECEFDSDCGQVLEYGVCDCESGNAVMRNGYNSSWLYGMLEEAELSQCSLELGDRCDCETDANVDLACIDGQCGWL